MQHVLFVPLLLAILQVALPQRYWAGLTTVTLIGCFALLLYFFLVDSQQLLLVLQHSHPAMPNVFKIGASWGNHEGSMLLWIMLLALPFPFLKTSGARQVGGWLIVGAIIFLYFTANPFWPPQGIPENKIGEYTYNYNGLNPLLQDIALMIHPPILYIGYTLAAVPFCYVVGGGKQPINKFMRPYISAAWAFLTVGIALGSWWAYRELGWGGWWFWDPVENASLVPWLLLTALMHSNISTVKFNLFVKWTALLAVLAFSSAVLGMFLTRSGLLVSVHAFASDPTRGMVLLGYFGLIISMGLISVVQIKNNRQAVPLNFWSRENFILLNNVMMLASAAIILVATMWPLLDKDISIGAPFYNQAVVPIFLLVFPLMALAVILPWQRDIRFSVHRNKIILLVISGIFGLLLLYKFNLMAMANGAVLASLIMSLCFLKRKTFPLLLGHGGIAVSVLGMLLVSILSEQKIMALSEGGTIEVSDKTFELKSISQGSKDNYIYRQAVFTVNNKQLAVQNRLYPNNRMNTNEVGILPVLFSHYYLVLGEKEQKKYTVHLYYYPGIRFIWLGAVIMAIGGLYSVVLRVRK